MYKRSLADINTKKLNQQQKSNAISECNENSHGRLIFKKIEYIDLWADYVYDITCPFFLIGKFLSIIYYLSVSFLGVALISTSLSPVMFTFLLTLAS